MTLPFPRPLPPAPRALSGDPPLPAPLARTPADLASALERARLALRDLEDAARCVPGPLAARCRAVADDCAAEVEAAGYDLFLAVGEAAP